VTDADASLELLIARVAEGDRQAFASLYTATSAKLFGLALRIVRERAVAEDVMQECWIRIWNNAARYDMAAGRPVTWLAAVARNAAIDAVRQKQLHRRRHEDDEGDALAAVPAPSAGDPMERRGIERCLGELEDEHRACVLLAYVEGYSREELAGRYDKPVGTIKTWLHRGLKRLKDCLDAP
jgi:RNA polymerase sigma-70 factor (ECF subfamily)